MDLLAEVLQTIKLDAAMYFNGEFSAPWSVHNPGSEGMSGYLTSKGGHVIFFHTILEGTVRIRFSDGTIAEVLAGSIIICPRGDSYVLGNGHAVRPTTAAYLLKNHVEGRVTVAKLGGGGELTRLVCGYLSCEPTLSRMVLDSLPKILVLPIKPGTSGDWIRDSIRFLVNGNHTGDGHQLILSKLSEALFLEMLRQYVNDLPQDQRGWFAGARDPFVSQALARLHQRPEHPWTLPSLGREIGLSRTRLAERFTQFVGTAPMTYLTQWRLRMGAQLLSSSDKGVAEIAQKVGYGSEAGFARAFKKEFGLPPAQFRRSTVPRDALPVDASCP